MQCATSDGVTVKLIACRISNTGAECGEQSVQEKTCTHKKGCNKIDKDHKKGNFANFELNPAL
jgi:hypothetical protein